MMDVSWKFWFVVYFFSYYSQSHSSSACLLNFHNSTTSTTQLPQLSLLDYSRARTHTYTNTCSSKESEDFDQEIFPSATPAHWKVLMREIAKKKDERALTQAENRRNLVEELEASHQRRLAQVDTKSFKGVRVNSDNSLLGLGECEPYITPFAPSPPPRDCKTRARAHTHTHTHTHTVQV